MRILNEQFDISYYVKGITYTDTENMAIFERNQTYNRLLRRKNEEKEIAEENAKKIQATRAATVSPSRRRR